MRRKPYRDSYVSAHLSNTVAAQIAAMRESRGWTQTELAKRAGMKQPRISALEDPNCENFEAETLRRLASAFDVGLTIRFAPFSEIVEYAASITEDKMSVRSFEFDDVALATELSSASNKTNIVPYLRIADVAVAQTNTLAALTAIKRVAVSAVQTLQ
jgi:transcriptional regulator with XRE-family HTH domain